MWHLCHSSLPIMMFPTALLSDACGVSFISARLFARRAIGMPQSMDRLNLTARDDMGRATSHPHLSWRAVVLPPINWVWWSQIFTAIASSSGLVIRAGSSWPLEHSQHRQVINQPADCERLRQTHATRAEINDSTPTYLSQTERCFLLRLANKWDGLVERATASQSKTVHQFSALPSFVKHNSPN